MQTHLLRRGLLLAFLLACCVCFAGCTPAPIVRTDTVTVRVPVPQPVPVALTTPIKEPAIAGPTNADLAAYAIALRQAVRDLNVRLGQIAEWGAKARAPPGKH